jgi:hypothetical protein
MKLLIEKPWDINDAVNEYTRVKDLCEELISQFEYITGWPTCAVKSVIEKGMRE